MANSGFGYSTFKAKKNNLYSCNIGELIPVFCESVLPGDKWRLNDSYFIRSAPMLAPLMHQCDIFVSWFFVPMRLIVDSFDDFLNPSKQLHLLPHIPSTHMYTENYSDVPYWFDGVYSASNGNGRLFDMFGYDLFSSQPSDSVPVNILRFNAYQKIWNDYFRDDQLQPEYPVWDFRGPHIPVSDGRGGYVLDPSSEAYQYYARKYEFETNVGWNDFPNYFAMHHRSFRKDYFTSARPDPQLGAAPSVPVYGSDGGDILLRDVNFSSRSSSRFNNGVDLVTHSINSNSAFELQTKGNEATPGYIASNLNGKLSADSLIGGFTIEDFRKVNSLQKFLEMTNRVGTRYIELLKANWPGVKPLDARLDRAELISAFSSPLVIEEISQTSETQTTPLGQLAGQGRSARNRGRVNFKAREHGYLIALCNVLPKNMYMSGIKRDIMKSDRYDFYWPQFDGLGDQPIYNYELFVNGYTSDKISDAFKVFGYSPRYSEYKFFPSEAHGDFKTSLDYWHLARKFANAPALNSQFIVAEPDLFNRIWAVPGTQSRPLDHLYFMHQFDISVTRQMSKYGTPHL